MLRLRRSDEPVELDFGGGVKIWLRPMTTDVNEDAKADPNQPEVVSDRDEDGKIIPTRKHSVAYMRVLARAAVLSWEGIYGEEGDDPLPVTPETIDAVMDHPVIFSRFEEEYVMPSWTLVSEKNG